MYVISKINTDYFTKDEQYIVVNADKYEYQIEYKPNHLTWIGKDEVDKFEYHV